MFEDPKIGKVCRTYDQDVIKREMSPEFNKLKENLLAGSLSVTSNLLGSEMRLKLECRILFHPGCVLRLYRLNMSEWLEGGRPSPLLMDSFSPHITALFPHPSLCESSPLFITARPGS